MEKYLMVFDDIQEWEEWSKTHLILTGIKEMFTLDDGQVVVELNGGIENEISIDKEDIK